MFVFYSKNIYFRYVWQPRKQLQVSLSWELLKISVRRKTGEGRRVRRKSLSQAVKTSRSHEEGDKRFPEEIPKGEVPSAKKKCFS